MTSLMLMSAIPPSITLVTVSGRRDRQSGAELRIGNPKERNFEDICSQSPPPPRRRTIVPSPGTGRYWNPDHPGKPDHPGNPNHTPSWSAGNSGIANLNRPALLSRWRPGQAGHPATPVKPGTLQASLITPVTPWPPRATPATPATPTPAPAPHPAGGSGTPRRYRFGLPAGYTVATPRSVWSIIRAP